MRLTRYVKLQKPHEKDLDYKEQLLSQKPQESTSKPESKGAGREKISGKASQGLCYSV